MSRAERPIEVWRSAGWQWVCWPCVGKGRSGGLAPTHRDAMAEVDSHLFLRHAND